MESLANADAHEREKSGLTFVEKKEIGVPRNRT
jgi:hypothetical protein